MCTGSAVDRMLMVAGLAWPAEPGLEGHSDADVACHAAADALFNAAGIGDLGAHFGTAEPQWAGASGLVLLAEAGTSGPGGRIRHREHRDPGNR